MIKGHDRQGLRNERNTTKAKKKVPVGIMSTYADGEEAEQQKGQDKVKSKAQTRPSRP
jgi:hypothetical protein